jgi:hypothetical protein
MESCSFSQCSSFSRVACISHHLTPDHLVPIVSLIIYHIHIVNRLAISIATQPLVNKESLDLVVRLAELLVLAHEHNLCNPGAQSGRNRECSRRAERNDVAGLVGLGPQVRSPVCVVSDLEVGGGGEILPDEGRVHDSGNNTDGNGLLLGCLTTSRSAPTENQGVDAVGADGEDDHGGVASRNADGRACDEETNSGDGLGGCNVPCSLVELARGPGDGDCDGAGDQVGWAGQDKGDELAEAESLHDSREKVLETVRS